MLLLVAKLRVTVLTLKCGRAILFLIKVELILDEYILAEIARQISCTLDFHNVVDTTVEEVFGHVWQILICQVFVAILIYRHHIDI